MTTESMRRGIAIAVAWLGVGVAFAAPNWQIEDEGLVRFSPRDCHDFMSMGSRGLDAIVEWSVSRDGAWSRTGFATFPTLRVGEEGPGVNSTRGSWRVPFGEAESATVNGRPLSAGVVAAVRIGATVKVEITHDEQIEEVREIFPANTARALLERVSLRNASSGTVEIVPPDTSVTSCATGVFGKVVCERRVYGPSSVRLAPGCGMAYVHCLSGRGENDAPYVPDAQTELAARKARWQQAASTLVLETPVKELDRMFLNAKFHTLESLYFTRGGIVHCSGGYGNYLGAIWANDQMEYAHPLLVMLGEASATQAAFTGCRWFARQQNRDFRPIDWSIVSEGRHPFSFKKDRGDQAMMAHGTARVALAAGDRRFAEEIEPFVAWCLEYGRRRLTADGVVASETDEMEGRLPTGKANLNTSSLQYDGLLRAADLLDALGKDPARAADYRARAARLADAIERHFGGVVEGFDCYRYYEGNDKLRSWIATPLCFGLDKRAKAIGQAIFSPLLWNGIGLRSVTGAETYWDRSALYAFRGLLFCGQADRVMPHLMEYTRMRLLGDHVPYPIEAYPEHKGSHLAAESALYCRIFTEGLFGLTPTGLDSFRLRPNLPTNWNRAALRHIHAFGSEFNVEMVRVPTGIRVTVTEGSPAKTVLSSVTKPGESIDVRLSTPDEVKVSSFGFDAADSTRFLQAAINSGAKRVIIDRQATPWITLPLKGASNQELFFEPGVELVAKRGEYREKGDVMLSYRDATNVTISGSSAMLKMWVEDYMQKPYELSEWRHAISFISCVNVKVSGLTIDGSGGDGIYISSKSKARPCCRDVVIRDVVSRRNARQGISVISVENLLIENCKLNDTCGRPPQSGIDFEPNHPHQRLVNCVMRNCEMNGNRGDGITVAIQHLHGATVPISLTFENCRMRDNRYAFRCSQRSERGDFVKGKITVRDCVLADSQLSGIHFLQKPEEAFAVTFKDCRVENSCREVPDAADVTFDNRKRSDAPPDGFSFDGLEIVQPVAREPFDFVHAGWSDEPIKAIAGRVTVCNPKGVRTIEVDDAFRSRLSPVRVGPIHRELAFDKAKVIDKNPDELLKLTPLELRGQANYVFYADRAKTVRFVGKSQLFKARRDRKPLGKTRVRAIADNWAVELETPVKSSEFAVEVPAAGFYALEVGVGSQVFCLQESSAPVGVWIKGEDSLGIMGVGGTVYLRAVEPFSFHAAGEGFAERVGVEIFDPSGASVWKDAAVLRWQSFAAEKVVEGLWTIKLSKPSKGTLEDYRIDVRGTAPILFLCKGRWW